MSVSPAPGVDSTILSSTDPKVFIAVLRELRPVTRNKWSVLGQYLGVSYSTNQRINQDNPRSYSAEQEMIRAWLNTGAASWAMLVSALKKQLVGLVAIGNGIARKYPSEKAPNSLEQVISIPVQPADGVDDTILKDTELLSVLEAVSSVTQWSVLSILLGINEDTIDRIKQGNQGQALTALEEIVMAWLQGTDRPSWAVLVSALRDDLVGLKGIANEIASQHPKTSASNVVPKPIDKGNQPPSSDPIPINSKDGSISEDDLKVVVKLLKPKYVHWDKIGSGLDVSYNFRQELLHQGLSTSGESKLEAVIYKWHESRSSEVTWEHLASVMRELEFVDIAEEVEKRFKL